MEHLGEPTFDGVGRSPGSRFRAYGPRRLGEIAEKYGLDPATHETVRLFSLVLPFQVNEYVLTQLIDWRDPAGDPMFHLFFPQPGMLTGEDEDRLRAAEAAGPDRLGAVVRAIRARLNPHPEQQMELNVPSDGEGPIPGVQHKYDRTLLYFPASGQTCHTYCTYCFRWAQFVGDPALRFAATDPARAVGYLRAHPDITDVLVTGGDPMVMSEPRLRRHLEPLLAVPSVQTVRIGTKSVATWPHRFVTDTDADDTLRLFEQIVDSGRTLAVMAHFSHPAELATGVARQALARIRRTGAVVYCQAPLIGRVNDDPAVWSDLWHAELRAGTVPYYMFVARDTGPRDYYKVPLTRAAEIFRDAYSRLPGLARTVRGPVMSTTAGKIAVDGLTPAAGSTDPTAGPAGSTGSTDSPDPTGPATLQLRFLQARDPRLVGRPFQAAAPAGAAWIDELVLAADTPRDIAEAVRSGGH